MHITRAIVVLSSLVFGLLAGCSSTPPTASSVRSSLEGCWYGEDYQPVFRARSGWLMNRKADGTFSIEFRAVGSGPHTAIQTEGGRWGYADGKYTTVTTVIDGKAVEPPYVDDYELKSISDSQMTYYHAEMNMTFTSRRVACDFKAP